MKKNLFFSFPDTPRDKFLSCLISTVHKQVLLGLLFVLAVLPLFTLLSSWTALFCVCRKLYDGEEVRTFSDFFSAFKRSFRKTALPSCLFALLFAAGISSAKIYFSLKTVPAFFGGTVCVCFLLIFLLAFLFMPRYLLFEKGSRPFFEAFVLFLPRCALCLAAVGLICGVLFLLLPFSAPVFFTLAFPLSCLCCVFIFDRKGKNGSSEKDGAI